MVQIFVLVFSTTSAVVAMASLGLFLCFLNDFALPITVDRPMPEETDLFGALGGNVFLIALFGLQHSGMARDRWKSLVKRFFPEALVAPIYVMASAICLFLLMAFWQPIPPTLWTLPAGVPSLVVYAIQCAGWGLAVYSASLIDPLELLGLRQAIVGFRGGEYQEPRFYTGSVYRYVRHPLQGGVLVALYAMPTMTVGHLILNVGLTSYIFVGTCLEERDLLRKYGAAYAEYRASTPRFIPRIAVRGSRHRRE